MLLKDEIVISGSVLAAPGPDNNSTSFQFFENTLALETRTISDLVKQDVLLFAGSKEEK